LFVTKIPLIEANRDAQIADTKSITEEKNSKLEVMQQKGLFICNRLMSYASATGNTELFDSVKILESELKRTTNVKAVGINNNILAKVTASATYLTPYSVVALTITDYKNAIMAYSAMLVKPKTVQGQTKNATQTLAQLYKEENNTLKTRLDLDIEVFKTSNPDFYSQYQTARVVQSRGSSKLSLIGMILTSSGEPLKNATITIDPVIDLQRKGAEQAPIKSIVKKSSVNGRYKVSKLNEGHYNIIVTKPGFKKTVTSFIVVNCETLKLRIELEKE
jgi:hypothetical protein